MRSSEKFVKYAPDASEPEWPGIVKTRELAPELLVAASSAGAALEPGMVPDASG